MIARWATPAHMTRIDLADPKLAGVPDDVEGIRTWVGERLVHRELVGLDADEPVPSPARLRDEPQLRSVEDMVAAMAPPKRLVGVCRHFTVLFVALLRAKGIPARARCGHASYFEAGRWVDHWVAEHHDGDRWIRSDPQLDEVLVRTWGIGWSPDVLPPGLFLTGAECWQRIRAGDIDPQTCGIAHMWGAWFVRSNLVRDLASVNKHELLPWDGWGFTEREIPDDEVDELARIVVRDDLDELRAAYAADGIRVDGEVIDFSADPPARIPVPDLG